VGQGLYAWRKRIRRASQLEMRRGLSGDVGIGAKPDGLFLRKPQIIDPTSTTVVRHFVKINQDYRDNENCDWYVKPTAIAFDVELAKHPAKKQSESKKTGEDKREISKMWFHFLLCEGLITCSIEGRVNCRRGASSDVLISRRESASAGGTPRGLSNNRLPRDRAS
jgi:hypothetical protein